MPNFADMLDSGRTDELIREIEASGVTQDEKNFLVQAARRHNVFNYRAIAEYYAQATPEMQRLMEHSALVIIDVDDAIALLCQAERNDSGHDRGGRRRCGMILPC